MRTRDMIDFLKRENEPIVACFGSARLVRARCGRLEVRGGTEIDQGDARRWVARFLTPPAGYMRSEPIRRPAWLLRVSG